MRSLRVWPPIYPSPPQRRWAAWTIAALLAAMLCVNAADARPVVWQVNDPVRPGETCVMFGDGFGVAPKVCFRRENDGPAGKPGTPIAGSFTFGAGAAVLQASDQCLKVLITPERNQGLFRLSVDGTDVAINRPTVWWSQVDYGDPGSKVTTLRLFGKNLAGPSAQVYLKGPRLVALPIGKHDDTWAAQAVLPPDLPAGDYQLFYHSGYGGPLGWSAASPVTISRPRPWPSAVYNVRDFGADGSATRDDTAALQAALDRAGAAGGGVVFLPRGRYQMNGTLKLPRFTVLRGDAASETALFWPDMATPPEALIQGTNSFALENLTIYASMAHHIIVGDQGITPDAGNVRLWRVRTRVDAYRGHLEPAEVDKRYRDGLRTNGGAIVRLGGDSVRITECDLYGTGMALYLSRARNSVVRGNTLYNGRGGWYEIAGSDGLIFENNTITGDDLMATGGGLDCLDGSSYSQNVWFSHNKLSLMHGWDREAMTSDAGGGLYYGPITKAEGTALTLPEAPRSGRNWAGAAVFVFNGKGWTQMRRVVKVEGDTVTIDRPWDVAPDNTSLIGITMLQRHYILEGNDFSDAGIAIQFYGTSYEHIVSGNTCARAGGYQGIGKPYGGYNLPPDKNPCHQPSWFCQFVDNEITEGSIYRSGANNSILSGDSVIGVFGWPLTKDWPWPYNVGSVVKRNTLDNNARLAVGGSANDKPSVSDTVVEHNTVSNANEGLRLDNAVRGVVVRANRFDNVRDPITGDGLGHTAIDAVQLAEAERSRLRTAAKEAGLAEDPTKWPAVALALQALENAAETAAPESARQVLPAFLAEAGTRGVKLPFATATRLLGLSVEVNPASTVSAVLQKGGGGNSTLVVDLTVSRALPGWQVTADVPGLMTQNAAIGPVAVQSGKASLTLPISMPSGRWGRQELSLQVGVVLPPPPSMVRIGQGMVAVAAPATPSIIHLTVPLVVGTGQIRDWMVGGPFANKSGQPLDLTLYPPEDELNLQAQYDGLKWQPVQLGNEWLDLNALLRTKDSGTAYAVAGIHAEKGTPAILQFGSSGGVAISLNGQYLTSINQSRNAAPNQDRVPLTLAAGDNVLLVKTSTNTNQWRFTAELVPAGGSFPGAVSIIPAAQFAGRAAFAPPKPRTAPQTGEVRFPAGVDWKLVYADDFAGDSLSARWRSALGQWTAHGGLLQSSGDKAFLGYAEKLPAPMRLEYDTRVVGDAGGDLSPFWLNDPSDYASGYLIGFGSNGNTANKVLVDGSETQTSTRPLVVPGKWHHVIAQILADGRVQLIVDGQLSLDYKGPAPGAPKHPGLWTWGPEGVFSKVRVYSGGG